MKNLSRILAAVAAGLVIRSILSVVVVAVLVVAVFAGGLSVDLRVEVGGNGDNGALSAIRGGSGGNSGR